MKNAIILLTIATLVMSCNQDSEKSSTEEIKSFGVSISADNVINASELISTIGENDSLVCKVGGKIDEVCQKSGCWLDIEMDENNYLFVKFKDYSYSVSKDIAGKNVVVQGVAYKEITSVEALIKDAKEEGLSQAEIDEIKEPETSYSFIAEGVLIQ